MPQGPKEPVTIPARHSDAVTFEKSGETSRSVAPLRVEAVRTPLPPLQPGVERVEQVRHAQGQEAAGPEYSHMLGHQLFRRAGWEVLDEAMRVHNVKRLIREGKPLSLCPDALDANPERGRDSPR